MRLLLSTADSEDAVGGRLTLWLRAGAHRGDLERPVGLSLGHGDLHALLRRHGDVWLGFRDGGQELVHVRFLLLEKLVWGEKHKLPTSRLVWHVAARMESENFNYREQPEHLFPFLLTTN